jgi:hypothetical protein
MLERLERPLPVSWEEQQRDFATYEGPPSLEGGLSHEKLCLLGSWPLENENERTD